MLKDWYIVCLMRNFISRMEEFPLFIGRETNGAKNFIVIDEPFVSGVQFALDMREGRLWYLNQSETSLAFVDGECPVEAELSPDTVHIVQIGDLVIGLGTDVDETYRVVADRSPDLFKVILNGEEVGPLMACHLYEGCEKGLFDHETQVAYLRAPDVFYPLGELLSRLGQSEAPSTECAAEEKEVPVEELAPVIESEPAPVVEDVPASEPVAETPGEGPSAEPSEKTDAEDPVAETVKELAVEVAQSESAEPEPEVKLESVEEPAPVIETKSEPVVEEVPVPAPTVPEPAVEVASVKELDPTAEIVPVAFEPVFELVSPASFEPLPVRPVADYEPAWVQSEPIHFEPLPEQPLVDFEPRFE